MTHHEHPNVTVVREGFEAFSRGDMAWMDQHLADDVAWHVGGNSKWAGAHRGKDKVLEYFARQAKATSGPPSVEIHDIVGNDDHVVVLGTASASTLSRDRLGCWVRCRVRGGVGSLAHVRGRCGARVRCRESRRWWRRRG